MAYKQPSSGPFKMMGSSPAKQAKTSGFGPSTAFGGVKNPELIKDKKKPFSKKVMTDGKKTQVVYKGKELKGNWQPHPSTFKSKKSPAKQRSTKGGEGKDQDKIFDKNGKHVGDYVNGKKVMKSTTSAHGQLNDAKREFEQDKKNAAKMSKKKSPAKQLKGSGHGPATKFDKKRYPVGNPELTDKNPFKKDDYYYKVNGKATTKAAYLKHKNKPGNMEGGGKQTNNPDVYGRKKGGSPSKPK